MSEHGWPGWPDDPTGGDAHGEIPHDPGTPDHDWPADDPWHGRYADPGPDDHDPGPDDPADHGHVGWDHGASDPDGAHDSGIHDGLVHDSGAHDGGADAGGDPAGEAHPGDLGAHHDGAAHDDSDQRGTGDHDGDGWAADTAGHAMGPVGADPDAVPDTGHDPVALFPPAVHVGPLPEPVDGFPWVDTGSLGIARPTPTDGDGGDVAPEEHRADLAAYAATELPPAADPWAELAAAEDPATSALARWWAPGR